MSSFCSRFDPLYCQEYSLEEEEETEQHAALPQEEEEQEEEEEEEDWAEAFSFLLSRELETHPLLHASAAVGGGSDDAYLGPPRSSAVEWVVKISASHGFSAQTAMLAINYLDRCFLAPAAALRLQEDKPWMGRLAAAACLSLAAKVEETCVPLLLDLQLPQPPPPLPAMEEMGYVFEGRTVRRMELLVLSSLGWRMNPVTPLSLVHRLLPKLPATSGRRRKIFNLCETALLAVVVDWRWVLYPPSVWASAALLHAKERQEKSFDSSIAASPAMAHSFHLLGVTKEAVEGGYLLIRELAACSGGGRILGGIRYKRKHLDDTLHDIFHSSPPSPIGVIDSCFSCEGSLSGGESWAMWPLPATSSSKPQAFKKPNLNPITDNSESNNLVVK